MSLTYFVQCTLKPGQKQTDTERHNIDVPNHNATIKDTFRSSDVGTVDIDMACSFTSLVSFYGVSINVTRHAMYSKKHRE